MERLRELCRRLDPCVGIDCSDDTMRLAASPDLALAGGGRDLLSFRYRKDNSKAYDYGAKIRTLLRDRFSHCVIGLPRSETFTKTVVVPSHVSCSCPRSFHQWARSQLPLDETDIVVAADVHIIKGTTAKVASIAAIKRTRLQWFQEIGASAGLSVERVTLRQCGLVYGVRSSSVKAQVGVQVVVDTEERPISTHIFYDSMWLGTWEAVGSAQGEGSDISHIQKRLITLGVPPDEHLTVFRIGDVAWPIRIAQPESEMRHVIIAPNSYGEELYASGLAALEGSCL